MICTLCSSGDVQPYHHDQSRSYLRCSNCDLVFVPVEHHLCPDEEKAQYDFHENDPDDSGYRKFLSRIYDPMIERLGDTKNGLDFGSGPGPTLSLMFEEAGHTVDLYDVFYANDAVVFDNNYDFITATEVVEHLSKPMQELDRLWRCLKPGGVLGIMTKRVTRKESFTTWHYTLDPTHISFFSEHSFKWLGEKWGSKPEFIGGDVVLFIKP